MNEELYDVVRFTERFNKFIEGNRNIFIFRLACNMSFRGIELSIAKDFILSQYSSRDFSSKEILATLNTAYRKTSKAFGRFKKNSNIDISLVNKRLSFVEETIEELDLTPRTIPIPLGYKRIYQNNYIDSRGFSYKDYTQYNIGITTLMTSLKDYVVFVINQQGKRCDAYVGRAMGNQEPKYLNSRNAEFHKILLGYNEISNDTHTVCLVEGIFDKKAIDLFLDTEHNPWIKCCATFGKKISTEQIHLLMYKDIQNIILLYDIDAMNTMKNISGILDKYFNVLVGIPQKKDPDECSPNELTYIFDNLKSPQSFQTEIIQKNRLKIS